jgi:hypothetical protein
VPPYGLRFTLHAVREQKLLHVLQQELLGFRITEIQPVVVDELLLGLCPLRPANAADLFVGTAAEIGREGLEGHALTGLGATDALECRHGGKIGDTGNVIQSTGGPTPTS